MMNDPERAAEPPMVRNFIEFLYMFGHFVSTLSFPLFFRAFIEARQAGEDLEEIEEEDELEEEEEVPGAETSPLLGGSPYGADRFGQPSLTVDTTRGPAAHKATERSPLLTRSAVRSRSRRRLSSVGPHGDATVTDAVLMVR